MNKALFIASIVASIFLGKQDAAAQQAQANPTIAQLWISPTLDDDQSMTRSLEKFNFHPATKMESAYFEGILKGQNFSLFIVNNTNEENDLAIGGIDETSPIQISNNAVVNKKVLPYSATANNSKILFYKDRWSQKIKDNPDLFLENLKGDAIAEIILFDRAINKIDQAKIESYLAIKYGISMAENFQYYSSKENKIFQTTENDVHRNRIAALGRDDNATLYQKQSSNHETDLFFCLSLDGMHEFNSQNTGALLNESFIFWADDNALLDFSETDNTVLDRTWKFFLDNMKEEEKEIQLFIELPEQISAIYPEQWVVSLSGDAQNTFEPSEFPLQRSENGLYQAKLVLDKSKGNEQILKIFQRENHTNKQANIELYPNPIKRNEKCKVVLNDLPEGEVNYFVRDHAGKLISTNSIFNSSTRTEFELRFSGLGMHTVEIEYAGVQITKPIIVID